MLKTNTSNGGRAEERREAAHDTRRATRGFTTIEIVIVLVIAAIIFTIATSAFSTFNKNQALSGSVDDVVSVLSRARNQTLASRDDYAYGVHFESDRIILFRGSAYDPATSTNETVLLSSLVTITDISLAGGGNDVLFHRLSGTTDESGAVTIALLRDSAASSTVTILQTGIVEKE